MHQDVSLPQTVMHQEVSLPQTVMHQDVSLSQTVMHQDVSLPQQTAMHQDSSFPQTAMHQDSSFPQTAMHRIRHPHKRPCTGFVSPTNGGEACCSFYSNGGDQSEPLIVSQDDKGSIVQTEESQPPPLPVSNLSPYAPEFIPRRYRSQPQASQSNSDKSLLDYIKQHQFINYDPSRDYHIRCYQFKGTFHYIYHTTPWI